MPTNAVPPVHALVAHTTFVRSVARAILRDADLADDVVQDTMVAAIEGGHRRRGAMRSWLGGIARKRAIDTIRSRQAARRREARAARSERAPSLEGLADLAEAGRCLTKALLTLPEHYRAILLLRYYEDLPPRHVSERLGVPVETVRTRTRRGLALLRDEFERVQGQDRKRTRAVLSGLAWPSRAGTAALVVTGVTLAKLVASFALVGFLIGAWLWSRQPEPEIDLGHTAAALATTPAETHPSALYSANVTAPPLRGAVRVRVMGAATQEPLRGVTVAYISDPNDSTSHRAEAETDGNGVALFERLPPTRVAMLHLSGMGGPPRHMPLRPVVANEVLREVVWWGAPGQITGAVRSIDGEPLGAAEIRVYPRAPDTAAEQMGRGLELATNWETLRPIATSRSDPDGTFALRDVAPGHWTVVARHERYDSDSQAVSVRSTATNSSVLLELVPALTRRGRLLDADGRPIVDAEVACRESLPAELHGYRFQRTDFEGTFLIQQPRSRESAGLLIRAPGYPNTMIDVPTDTDTITLHAGTPRLFRFERAEGAGPLAGALVHLLLLFPGTGGQMTRAIHTTATTDHRGSFSSSLPNGSLSSVVLVHPATGRVMHQGGVGLQKGAGGLRALQSAELTSETTTLSFEAGASQLVRGTVREADGTTLAGVAIRVSQGVLRGPETISDRTGRFELRYTPTSFMPVFAHLQATYPGLVQSESGAALPSEATAHAIEVDLTLVPSNSLRGRLADPRGMPVANARVTCELIELHAIGKPPPRTLSNPDGSFEIGGVPSGATGLLLLIEHADFVSESIPIAHVRANEPTQLGSITLRGGATCAVHVQAPDGTPVPYAQAAWEQNDGVGAVVVEGLGLEAPPPTGRRGGTGSADRNGMLRLRRLRTGRYRVHVSARGYIPRTAEFSVPADDEQGPDVTVTLTPATILKGRVFSRDKPLPGARVYPSAGADPLERLALLIAGLQYPLGRPTDAEGHFRMETQPREGALLLIDHPDHYVHAVDPSAPEQLEEIRLQPLSREDATRTAEVRKALAKLVQDMSQLDPRQGIDPSIGKRFRELQQEYEALRAPR